MYRKNIKNALKKHADHGIYNKQLNTLSNEHAVDNVKFLRARNATLVHAIFASGESSAFYQYILRMNGLDIIIE